MVNGASFEIQTYDDFLWDKDAVDTVKFSIAADFKECDDLRKPIVLALCDNKGQIISEDLAEVYISGEKAAGNKIDIYPKAAGEQITEVGIVVNDAALAEDCTFNWHIKLCSKGQLESLSSIDKGAESLIGEQDPYISGMDIHIKNVHVANSLKVGTNMTLLAILVALVLWIFYAHACKWPKAKFSRVEIDYHDGMGPRPIRMGGAHDLVFTDKKKSDSLLKKIFKCTTKYEEHPFWTHEVKMVSSKTRGRLRVSNLRTFYVVGDTVQKEEFQIVNEAGEKVTIVTT